MTITKKPVAKKASAETKAQRFIESPAAVTTPKRDLRDVIIGFDRQLLERIDRRAQDMGLSRTAFVVNAVAEKLMHLEGGPR